MTRPETIPAETWRLVPPIIRDRLARLARCGLAIGARINRNGRVRYSVGPIRDIDGAALLRRYGVR